LLEAAIPHALTTVSVDPAVTHILARANWMDDSAPIVEPAIPRFLGVLDTKGERASRLELSNWLVSRDNPLTARAFVNRMWREFFGVGISKVLDDLGSQGEWPTHAELLDWLASEFMHPEFDRAQAHDWDVKHLVRLIVTSYAYRQSSLAREGQGKDPENRLLARQNRYRLDAENVRDTLLQISGLLVERLGGPSVNPVEPAGYLAALNFPKREYSASRGDDLYRRGLYTTWQRSYLHPSLLNFDAPTREECAVNRTMSNTPLQALDLLNDPIYVEGARVFAQNAVAAGGGTFESRIDWIFDRALNRPPSAEERSILRDLYDRNRQRGGRNLHRAVDVDRADQPRSGPHLHEQRLDHRRPAVHGVVGAIWIGRGGGQPARLCGAGFAGERRPDATHRGAAMVGRHFAQQVSGGKIQFGWRSGSIHRESSGRQPADAIGFDPGHQRAEPVRRSGVARPGDSNPHRAVRDGVQDASQRARAARYEQGTGQRAGNVRGAARGWLVRLQLSAGAAPGRAGRALHPALSSRLGSP
jgi:hypothetical protein